MLHVSCCTFVLLLVKPKESFLGGRFGYFLFFLLFWDGEREEEFEAKRGGDFLLENRWGGGFFRGGEAGCCTPRLGRCREEGGG